MPKRPAKRPRRPAEAIRRRQGRPPAGQGGEAVTGPTYTQTTVRLPADAKRLLDGLTRLLGKRQRVIIAEALDLYVAQLKRSDRTLLRGLLTRRD